MALLVPVVAWGAKALPVSPIPKQHLVAAMRGDVIDKRGGFTTHGAARMKRQPFVAGFLPVACIAPIAGARALCIMAGVTGAGAGDLALAAGAMRHNAPASADMGWFWHYSIAFSVCRPARSKSGSRPAAIFS